MNPRSDPHPGGAAGPHGSGGAAAAGLLALAAAPTFAAMALWSAVPAGTPGLICTSDPAAAGGHAMTVMYALMGLFHLSPWLGLLSRATAGRGRLP